MLETFRELTLNQFEAALSTLGACVHQCPDTVWNAPVQRYPFCQVAFHTLFFADYYLEQSERSLRDQPFHQANQPLFADYEQLQPREPQSLYAKDDIDRYLRHCRDKAKTVISQETADELSAPSQFPGKEFTRAELHVYNIRHIQHHAAQLILRLRLVTEVDIPWFKSGWQESS